MVETIIIIIIIGVDYVWIKVLVSVWVVVSLCGRFSISLLRGDHVEFYAHNVGKIAIIVRVEPSGNPQDSAVPQSPKKLVITPPPPTPPLPHHQHQHHHSLPPITGGISSTVSTVSTAALTPISSGHIFHQSDINKVKNGVFSSFEIVGNWIENLLWFSSTLWIFLGDDERNTWYLPLKTNSFYNFWMNLLKSRTTAVLKKVPRTPSFYMK